MTNIELLNQTLRFLDDGQFKANEKTVSLKLTNKQMKEAVVLLPEDVHLLCSNFSVNNRSAGRSCLFTCEKTDSFSAAISQYRKHNYLYHANEKPVLVLNFANPVNPGGGVRYGARAQEEDLCRKSSLLLSLESSAAKAYYEYNREHSSFMGSDAMMISPFVEIIRDKNCAPAENTEIVSVLTCAAPELYHGLNGIPEATYRDLVFRRIYRMLICAALYGYKNLILGAWGCGAFGNDAAVVSDLFLKAFNQIENEFDGIGNLFRHVEFAVLSRSENQYNYLQFSRNFGADADFSRRQNSSYDEGVNYRNKIRGSLIGGAAGDALGYTIEFMDEASIFRITGPDGLRKYEYSSDSGKAMISDDTQMTMFTANGILCGVTNGKNDTCGPNIVSSVAIAYQDWLLTQSFSGNRTAAEAAKDRQSWLLHLPELFSRRAPGNTCLSALYEQMDGTVKASIGNPLNHSKGCGGVMRAAPMGLRRFSGTDIGTIDRMGAEIAAITHGNSLGYLPAAILTHIIHRIVYPQARLSLKEIITEAIEAVSKQFSEDSQIVVLSDLLQLAVSLSENGDSDLENIHRLGQGWVGEEALAIAVYCSLRHHNDFSAGIISAVNHNGDSDSTGAVTGNILGAWLGYQSIDDQWLRDLELHDVILALSDDLSRALPMDRDGSITDDNWNRKYMEGRLPIPEQA